MLAVLVDADNLSAEHADRLLAWVATKNAQRMVQVFGDFTDRRLSKWCELARTKGFEIVFQPNGGAGKNSTDIALVIRAMDLLHQNVVKAFCLASSDRDFVPLAQRLRSAGRAVFIAADHPDERQRRVSDGTIALGAPSDGIATSAALAAPLKSVTQRAQQRVKPPRKLTLIEAVLRILDGKAMTLSQLAQRLRADHPKLVPMGPGKLRKALAQAKELVETGTGAGLTFAPRVPA